MKITFTTTIDLDPKNQDAVRIARMLQSEINDAIRNADLSGTNSDQRAKITSLHTACTTDAGQTRR